MAEFGIVLAIKADSLVVAVPVDVSQCPEGIQFVFIQRTQDFQCAGVQLQSGLQSSQLVQDFQSEEAFPLFLAEDFGDAELPVGCIAFGIGRQQGPPVILINGIGSAGDDAVCAGVEVEEFAESLHFGATVADGNFIESINGERQFSAISEVRDPVFELRF